MAVLDTFIALRNYVKGKIDGNELLDADSLFSNMREDYKMPGQSVITVEFKNEEEFLTTMGLGDDDNWFYRVLNSPYSDYEFFDYYSAEEDFENGWGLYFELDDENKEKLSQISRAILPMKVNFDNEKFRSQLSEKLLTNFKKETRDIIEDYATERNYEGRRSARKHVNEEWDNYLSQLGFSSYGDGFKTTVANLIMLYLKENKIHLTLEELLSNIVESTLTPGGWNEDVYEYMNGEEFDRSSFNSYVSGKLDDILEKIEDGADSSGVSLTDFTAMTDRITKKFKQDQYYVLPKDAKKETRFKIEGFEFPNLKVVVNLQKGLKQKKVKLSEDNFYNLLYQPTLFNLDEI
jgi:hypothetical protein